MKAINEYAVSIIVVSVLATILEHLLPDGNNKKYTGVLIGLFVMLVMLNPLTKLPHYNQLFTLPQESTFDTFPNTENQTYVADSFEKKLAQIITDDVKETYETSIRCRIRCTVNDSGQITDIQKLTISPYSRDIGRYISEKYGIEEARITE